VIDLSAPGAEGQKEAVVRILEEIGAAEIPRLNIFNKIDRLPDREEFLKRNAAPGSEGLYVSAASGEGVPALRERLRSLLFRRLQLFYVRIPRDRKDVLEAFPKWTIVLKRRESGECFEMQIMADPEQMLPYLQYIERGGTPW
jgi:50S ribosomal subunit-associated GTPase HflX